MERKGNEDNSDQKPFELNVDYSKTSSTKSTKQASKSEASQSKVDYSKSKMLKTKQLAVIAKISSRKVNTWLTDNKLMYKKDDDWFTTEKGKESGGVEKKSFYGQEVLWPEEIASQIKG